MGTKKPYEKSPLYPAYSIGECVQFIAKIDDLGGRNVQYIAAAKAIGLNSMTAKVFTARLSACKQYGLITTANQMIDLTGAAQIILHSKVPHERTAAMVDAFKKPPLYIKLIEKYSGGAIPPTEQLANVLMKEFHLIQTVKDSAAEAFISGAGDLGLLSNGLLNMNSGGGGQLESTLNSGGRGDEPGDAEAAIPPEDAAGEAASQGTSGAKTAKSGVDEERNAGYQIEIRTFDGQKKATFSISPESTDAKLSFRQLAQKVVSSFLESLEEASSVQKQE